MSVATTTSEYIGADVAAVQRGTLGLGLLFGTQVHGGAGAQLRPATIARSARGWRGQ